MPKDYAKYGTKHRAPNKKNRHVKPLAIFFTLAVITFSCSWMFVLKQHENKALQTAKANWTAPVHAFFHHKQSIKTPAGTSKALVKAEPEEVHFNFYDELPTMQMTVSSEHPAPVASAKSENRREIYVLRIAEFKNESEAGQLRLSLLLEGIEAEVIKKGESYRVQQGAYSTSAAAKNGQKELEKQGIESAIEKS